MWYNAMYRPYTVTGGFQTLIREMKIGEGEISFTIRADGERPTVLVCLEEESSINSTHRQWSHSIKQGFGVCSLPVRWMRL